MRVNEVIELVPTAGLRPVDGALLLECLRFLSRPREERCRIAADVLTGKHDPRFIAPDVWKLLHECGHVRFAPGVEPGDIALRVQVAGTPIPERPNAHWELTSRGRAELQRMEHAS